MDAKQIMTTKLVELKSHMLRLVDADYLKTFIDFSELIENQDDIREYLWSVVEFNSFETDLDDISMMFGVDGEDGWSNEGINKLSEVFTLYGQIKVISELLDEIQC